MHATHIHNEQIPMGLRANGVRQLRCNSAHRQAEHHTGPIRHGRARGLGQTAHHVVHGHGRVHRVLLGHGAVEFPQRRREMDTRDQTVYA